MTAKTDHPFQPGVEVAIRTTTHGSWSLWATSKVEKAYKNGRFVLQGDTQQWRPSDTMGRNEGERMACAHEAGDNTWSRRMLFLLSDVQDEIKKDRAKQTRNNRLHKIRDRISHCTADNVTDEMLDAIEANLPPIEEPKDG